MPSPSAQPERPRPEPATESETTGALSPDESTAKPAEPELLKVPWLPWLCVAACAGLGVAALVGWAVDSEALRAIRPALKPLMPWTALGHIVAATAVAAVLGSRSRAGRYVGLSLAIAVAALGVVMLAQHVTGWDTGLDRLLFPEATGAAAIPNPGRVPVGSAAGFLLSGVSIVLASSVLHRRNVASQLLALVLFVLALFVLVGYALGVQRFYDPGPGNPTSLPSALAFLAMSVAILFARPRVGPVAVVLSAEAGGFVARRALAAALLIPLAFGWLRLAGERAGIFELEMGLALLIVAIAVFVAAIGWLNAYDLYLIDTRRRRVEWQLRYNEERLTATLEALPIGVWFTDESGRIVYGNSASRRIWGGAKYLSPKEFHEYKAWSPKTGERLGSEDWALSRALRNRESSIDEEIEIEAFDGTRKILRNSAVPLLDSKGEVRGAVVLNEDITERWKSEAERESARTAAEKRAREESALRRATAAVAAAYTVEAVTATIARTALEATDADSTLVERIDKAAGEVEVIASAAKEDVRIGPRLPYRGSLAERVVAAGHPIAIRLTGEVSDVPRYIVNRHPGSAILAIPMIEAGESIGSLILIRSRDRPDFEPESVERATTFAQLGSIAFRKAQLLGDSEARRTELEQVLERQSWLVRGFTHDVKNPLGAADGHLALVETGILDTNPERQRSSVASARAVRSTPP